MLRYTANGYIAAILIRKYRTLLVEGIDDTKILSRLLLELNSVTSRSQSDLVIDSAELIEECNGVVSNREKVEYIHSLVSDHDKLGAWVDREFRLFAVDHVIKDEVGGHNVLFTSLFWTRGHSVENYFFDKRIVISYLEQLYPEHLPSTYRQSIETVIDELTRYAASLSIAAKDLSLISRMNDLLNTGHWVVGAGMKIMLDDAALKLSLCQRGVDSKQADRYIERVRTLHKICLCTDTEVCRWIAHGHIGSSVVWSGVAATLAYCGMKEGSVIGKISHGDRDMKYRCASDIWSKATVAGTPASPLELVKWMRAD